MFKKIGKQCLAFLFILLVSLVFYSKGAYAEEADLVISLVGGRDIGKFKHPGGIFFDSHKKRLYVADTLNNRLVSFDSEYKPMAQFDASGKLYNPTVFVKNSKGIFFIIAGKKRELYFIDLNKRIFKTIDVKKAPETQSPIIPGKIAIDKDENLYITDRGNGRILLINQNGVCSKEIKIKGRAVDFSDVKVDAHGNIFSLSTTERRVYIFNKQGDLIRSFGERGSREDQFLFPVSLALDIKGNIFVLDKHKGNVTVFTKNGRFQYSLFKKGAFPGELYEPSYIHIDKNGLIYIADQGNDRIQIFKLSG